MSFDLDPDARIRFQPGSVTLKDIPGFCTKVVTIEVKIDVSKRTSFNPFASGSFLQSLEARRLCFGGR
jgi:hypothetical protein